MNVPTLRMVEGRLAKFKDFLSERGAEVLTPTNEWEVLRFVTDNGTAIVYKNKRDKLTFYGDAHTAWGAFNGVAGFEGWRAKPRSHRRINRTPVIAALRKRDGDLCFFCQNMVDDEDASEEHLLSRTHGGVDHIANKVLAHKKCNSRAGNLSVKEKINIHVLAVLKQRRANDTKTR